MILDLKGKIKRIDSGMGREEFAVFLSDNLIGPGRIGARQAGAVNDDGSTKPLFDWNWGLYRSVRRYRSNVYVVRPEYETEVIAALLMVGTVPMAVSGSPDHFLEFMRALGLKALHTLGYAEELTEDRMAVKYGLYGCTPTGKYVAIMAIGTDKCWLVNLPAIRQVNRLLTKEVTCGEAK